MFDSGKRYITKGIRNNVEISLQTIMWKLIDELKAKVSPDYLQVFELYVKDNGIQVIVHSQEQPRYKAEYKFLMTTPVDAKVYVIDDESHETMLLAEEY